MHSPGSQSQQPYQTSTSPQSKRISYKRRKSLVERRREIETIRERYPNKIPIVVERHQREKSLPQLDKTKFLVPQELTVSQFATIVRARMNIQCNQTFYLLISGRAMASMSLTLSEVYGDYRDADGFVYMTYASQETFG